LAAFGSSGSGSGSATRSSSGRSAFSARRTWKRPKRSAPSCFLGRHYYYFEVVITEERPRNYQRLSRLVRKGLAPRRTRMPQIVFFDVVGGRRSLVPGRTSFL
jgi:hypothetical protein